MRILLATLLVLVLSGAFGCSFSKSSQSISKSISSPFKSSSTSSGSGGEEEAAEPESTQDQASFVEDVTQLATTYEKTGGDIGALRSGVAKLAVARGITNWEVDPSTVQAIGAGVAQGGMTEDRFVDFSKDLFGDDLTKQNELRQGFESSAKASAP
jgi:hypothetical protein